MENSWKIPWYIAAAVILLDTIFKFMAFNVNSILWGLISLSLGLGIILFFFLRKDPIPIRGIFALLFAILLIIIGVFINFIVYFWAAIFLFIYACLRWTLWKYTSKE